MGYELELPGDRRLSWRESRELAKINTAAARARAAAVAQAGAAATYGEAQVDAGHRVAKRVVIRVVELDNLITSLTHGKPGLEAELRDTERIYLAGANQIVYRTVDS